MQSANGLFLQPGGMPMSAVQLADTWADIDESTLGPTDAVTHKSSKNENTWPQEIEPSGYYGLAGDLVRLIEPHTESDSVALLTQALVAFGNLIGARPISLPKPISTFATTMSS